MEKPNTSILYLMKIGAKAIVREIKNIRNDRLNRTFVTAGLWAFVGIALMSKDFLFGSIWMYSTVPLLAYLFWRHDKLTEWERSQRK